MWLLDFIHFGPELAMYSVVLEFLVMRIANSPFKCLLLLGTSRTMILPVPECSVLDHNTLLYVYITCICIGVDLSTYHIKVIEEYKYS